MIKLTQNQLLIVIAIGLIIISVIGYYIFSNTTSESYEQLDLISEETLTKTAENVDNSDTEIVVHIAGEINKPGIVKIKEGARIADIIESAGGLTTNADITSINLAYIIEDGQKITIPSKNQQESEAKSIENYISFENGEGIIDQTVTPSQTTEKALTKININKATSEQLQTLQGIGEATAQKIIDYRKEKGEFKQIEDLKNVPGIGDAKYEAIKDYIKVK